MESRGARSRALHDLFVAHRELTALEWLELKRSMVSAVLWLIGAALFGLAGWLSLNVAVIVFWRTDPLRAMGAVGLVNLALAALATWRARRHVHRPFFSLTRRELAADVATLWKVLP